MRYSSESSLQSWEGGPQEAQINTELGLLAITSCGLFPNTIGLVGKVRTTAIATFAIEHGQLIGDYSISAKFKRGAIAKNQILSHPIPASHPGGPSHTKTKPTNQNHHEIVRACESGGSIGQLYPISAVGITTIAVSSHPQLPGGKCSSRWKVSQHVFSHDSWHQPCSFSIP